MAGLYRYVIAGCALCCTALAQESEVSSAVRLDGYMETGMQVSGVRAPYYDEKGNLKAQLFGGHAKMLEGGVADVTDIRIEVYEEGIVVMTLFAPQCFTRVVEQEGTKVLSVESEGDVLIEMKQVSVSGRGFRFNSSTTQFEILANATVLVESAVDELREIVQ
ncbi:MAG: hypothetical protein JXR25_03270 [Pontiellaceae bacterium]|nr:hypothetical protein [Pontiellaceae bacterium]MBN2783824.1 hypothetical protein [Pontiellaceae bacterium]